MQVLEEIIFSLGGKFWRKAKPSYVNPKSIWTEFLANRSMPSGINANFWRMKRTPSSTSWREPWKKHPVKLSPTMILTVSISLCCRLTPYVSYLISDCICEFLGLKNLFWQTFIIWKSVDVYRTNAEFFSIRLDLLGESDNEISKSQSHSQFQSQSQSLQREDQDDSHLFEQLSENFDDPGCKDEDAPKKRSRSSRNSDLFYPASMMFFMLYGPYGVCAFNFDITSALTMDTKNLEEDAKSS